MVYKVVITSRANDDLRQVVRFLASKSPSAAERLGFRLLAMAQTLAVMPNRGLRVRKRRHVRRIPCGKWHAIYYRVREETGTIEILRYWDGRRDPRGLSLP